MRKPKFLYVVRACVVFAFLAACSPKSPQPIPTSTRAPTVTLLPPAQIPTDVPGPTVIVRTITGDSKPLSMPIDVAFDGEGNLYVLEAGAGRIQVFSEDGNSLRAWGSTGSNASEFSLTVDEQGQPFGFGGIAVDKDGNVYVADAVNTRVQKFDKTGNLLLQWGHKGSYPGQFLRPLSLTIDKANHVFVIDDLNSNIQEFDTAGKLIRAFGRRGTGNGELKDTSNIKAGPDGNLYVADFGNKRIQVFNSQGLYVRQWPTPSSPVAIALDSKGNSFVTDVGNGLTEFDATGRTIQSVHTLGLSDPIGIALDATGLVYVADQHNDRVLVLRLDK